MGRSPASVGGVGRRCAGGGKAGDTLAASAASCIAAPREKTRSEQGWGTHRHSWDSLQPSIRGTERPLTSRVVGVHA